MQNDILLRTLAGENTERPPVWLMRQAGRILPEYRAIRASLSGFKELVSTPDLAAEVTVQPVDALEVDAAIVFSDILVIPEAMGLDYELIEKVGPRFPRVIERKADIEQLEYGQVAAERLDYVYQALEKTQERLAGRVPLIGFAGAPWTLLCYMIEGQGSKTFAKARRLLHAEPEMAEMLMDKLTDTIISYLKLKVKHGAQVLQVFDSWSGVLSRPLYAKYGIKYLQRIAEAIDEVPLILFSKGAWFSLTDLAQIEGVALGLDWQTDPLLARDVCGADRILQGNLDPTILYANEEDIAAKTHKMISAFGGHHIVNLGHGVYPDTPLTGVRAFIQAVKTFNY
ncbi:MAG: uroporphyrinogen decarboxylase [Saprospiraceae bacterium]|nr:uroporphyrinogen decarboxylase [Saprospiraceae bacterium]